MRKKAFILASLCVICFFIMEANASSNQLIPIVVGNVENNIPNGADEIELIGKLDFNAGPDDIEAGATDNAVYIQFNRSFGNVNITLYNATGNIIYNCVVDTSMQQLVVIPITSMVSGTYTVVLSNANGIVEGDFNH
jgi:hypothetical protein